MSSDMGTREVGIKLQLRYGDVCSIKTRRIGVSMWFLPFVTLGILSNSPTNENVGFGGNCMTEIQCVGMTSTSERKQEYSVSIYCNWCKENA